MIFFHPLKLKDSHTREQNCESNLMKDQKLNLEGGVTILISKNHHTILSYIPFSHKSHVKKILKECKSQKDIIIMMDDSEIDIYEGGSVKLNFIPSRRDTKRDYTLPILYCIDKKEKERFWEIWVMGATVHKLHGEVGGKATPNSRTYKGLNKDKKNATTAEEQAKREAERDWINQIDKGYYPKTKEGKELAKKITNAKNEQGNVNTQISSLIRGGDIKSPVKSESKAKTKSKDKKDNGVLVGYETNFYPMHCHTWSDEQKVLKYFDFENGVYIQPKLDGTRCFVRIVDDKVVMTSRKGKQFVWLKHLRSEVLEFLKNHKDIILDCELYAHTITGTITFDKKNKATFSPGDTELPDKHRFNVITTACRVSRTNPHELEEQMCLYVFDIADESGTLTQDERFELLDELFNKKGIEKRCPHIKRVITKIIYNKKEIEEYHDEVAQDGYEGVVLRSRDLHYESNGRSLRMRKHKHFVDKEYPITGVICDEGVDREYFRWICIDKKLNKTFRVKPMGTREERWYWYDNHKKYKGKLLTVKFQELTADGVPRFGVGKCIRDYEG